MHLEYLLKHILLAIGFIITHWCLDFSDISMTIPSNLLEYLLFNIYLN